MKPCMLAGCLQQKVPQDSGGGSAPADLHLQGSCEFPGLGDGKQPHYS